jgi:hypothetical protein
MKPFALPLILALTAVLSSSARAEEEMEASQSNPDAHRWYIKGQLGFGGSRGEAYSANTWGLGYGVSAGAFLAPRWSLGLFYKSAATSTADMGLLGGGFSLARTYGLETDYSISKSESGEFRVGVKGARVGVETENSVIFLPVATTRIDSWGFGPTLGYFYFLRGDFAMGLEASYLQILASKTTSHTIIGDSQASIPTFGAYDVSLGLRLRIL